MGQIRGGMEASGLTLKNHKHDACGTFESTQPSNRTAMKMPKTILTKPDEKPIQWENP